MSKLNVICDDKNLCGEAPIWDSKDHCVYWSDCVGLKLFRYDWLRKKREILKEGIQVTGCVLNQPGGFVIVNNSGMWLWDGREALRQIASHVGDAKCQLNDCIADPQGRLISGSWFYDPRREPEPVAKLFCVENDGRTRILDEGFYLSNGLGFSADNRTLYYADSVARSIYAFDYDARLGSVARRRVFAKFSKDSGMPDGLTVDADGFIWCAEYWGSRVVRYDPDGKVERVLETPAKQTTSIIFGGDDLTDIFITSAGERTDPIPAMPAGYDPSSGYLGGRLYHINLGIKGKLDHRAYISLS